ncbi:MAG: hypothetical protein RR932_07530 [Acinetobacter sp.]
MTARRGRRATAIGFTGVKSGAGVRMSGRRIVIFLISLGDGMNDFEKWFTEQDFYTNMRFIHGDKIFDKDGDVYRVLPVQMAYQGWSSQRQRSKDEFIAITQEWHKKGYEAGQKDLREACFHFETSMFHRGTAQCFKCGAMVDRDRNIID